MTSKSVRTGPSSYEKRIYRTAASERLRNTGVSNVSAAVALLAAGTRTTTEFVWKKAHYNQRSATNTLVLNAPNQWFALPCCYVWRYKHDQVTGQLVTKSNSGDNHSSGSTVSSCRVQGLQFQSRSYHSAFIVDRTCSADIFRKVPVGVTNSPHIVAHVM